MLDSRGTRRLNNAFESVGLNDNTILAELLLDNDHLFCTFHHEISTWIQGTFNHPCQLCLVLPRQYTFVAPKHDRQPAYVDIWSPNNAFTSSVLYRDVNRRAIRDVS